MNCSKLVTAGLLLLTALGAQAQTPPPPCQDDAYRHFDFWVGEWQVELADGTQAGANSIAPAEKGCMLTERWQSAQGGTGQSINFYDPSRRVWRQVWVSPGVIIDIEGGLDGSSMILEGTIVYASSGARHPFRGTWTPLEDGRVRQFFEEQRSGPEWQAWFEGFYKRAEPAAP